MTKIIGSESPLAGLPSWNTLTHEYGPFLGCLVFFIIIVLILQFYWYKQNIKAKNEEIGRSVKRTTELETLVNKLINQIRSSKK